MVSSCVGQKVPKIILSGTKPTLSQSLYQFLHMKSVMPAQFLIFGEQRHITEVLITVQYFTCNPHHNTTTHNIKIGTLTLLSISSGFALYSLCEYGSGTSNSWHRRSLWVHARRVTLGQVALLLVPLFGAQTQAPSKNREKLGPWHLVTALPRVEVIR